MFLSSALFLPLLLSLPVEALHPSSGLLQKPPNLSPSLHAQLLLSHLYSVMNWVRKGVLHHRASAYILLISQVQTLPFRNTKLLGDFHALLCGCLFLKSSLFNRLTAHPSRKQACHPSQPGSHCTPLLPTVLLYSLGKDTSY